MQQLADRKKLPQNNRLFRNYIVKNFYIWGRIKELVWGIN